MVRTEGMHGARAEGPLARRGDGMHREFACVGLTCGRASAAFHGRGSCGAAWRCVCGFAQLVWCICGPYPPFLPLPFSLVPSSLPFSFFFFFCLLPAPPSIP